MKKIFIIITSSLFLAGALLFFTQSHTANKALADSNVPTILYSMNISASSTVTTTSSVILATSTGRLYAAIVNDGNVPIYLNMQKGAPALAGKGLRLNANGGSYEINNDNLYFGAITAISSSSQANVTVTATQ